MKRKQRTLSLAFLALFALSACGNREQIPQENRDYPFYRNALANKKTINLAFFKGVKDVPYLSLNGLKNLLESSMKDGGDQSYALAIADLGKTVTLTRENKARCTFAFRAGTISFSDYEVSYQNQKAQQQSQNTIHVLYQAAKIYLQVYNLHFQM